MNKQKLIDAVNAFADAKMTGNPFLVQLAGQHLEALLSNLPDELPVKDTEEKSCRSAPNVPAF